MTTIVARGSLHLDRGTIALVAGALILAALWVSPLPIMSQRIFSMHMALHLAVIVVVAPMLAYGLSRRLPPLASVSNALNWGLLAALADMVIVWGWHVPLLHDLAARSLPLTYLQQLSFLVVGLAVWTVALAAATRQAQAIAALVLFLTFMHMSMFGVVLTLAPALLYDPSVCLGGFGLSSLDDQRLGGILMAIAGGLPYLCGTAFVIYRFLEAGDPIAPPAESPPAPRSAGP
jgi:putative membrane protein